MGWIIVWVIELIVALTTFDAWFMGIITAIVVFVFANLIIFYNFSTAKSITGVIEILFSNNEFHFQEKSDAFNDYFKRQNISSIVYIISLGVTLSILILMTQNLNLTTTTFIRKNNSLGLVYLGFLISPLIVIGFIKWLNPEENLKKLARAILKNKLKSLKVAMVDITTLQKISMQIRNLAVHLKINQPLLPMEEATSEISSRILECFKKPEIVGSIISDFIFRGYKDFDGLKSSADLLEQVIEKHKRSRPIIFKTKSNSFIDSLDNILENLEKIKAHLLPQRAWLDFANIVNKLSEELNELTCYASNVNFEVDKSSNNKFKWQWENFDPYEILNVPRNAELKYIKLVRDALLGIYHEGGNAPDPERWKMINVAFDRIKEEKEKNP